MTTPNTARGGPASIEYKIETLERLLADLKRIRDGQGPTEDELAEAPIIHGYEIEHRLAPVLRGLIFGHPLLGTTIGTTSDLWFIAPDKRWVRTLSRFYRLGDKKHSGADGHVH